MAFICTVAGTACSLQSDEMLARSVLFPREKRAALPMLVQRFRKSPANTERERMREIEREKEREREREREATRREPWRE